ncbi:hypothetical protein [Steroidobacter agaridevorans]|uniref:hypothetical protein n=1 Tax=Steroidobacter agaridevorans TaxID=2695856 RepID=UPI0013273A5C|nr:hypothetical protein [Steroidobacter agaridevorans]GFE90220.1 hypothetical protein GCM10011488_51740 [Steroidobacter agaridevorans]
MSHTALSELIEHERIELMQVHAMVRCLNDVLLYSDDDDSSMHADVALVIARLVNESVGRLEKVRARVAELEQAAVAPPNQVREQRATYWVSSRRSNCGELDDGGARRSDGSEPWLMVRDCLDDARTGEYSCKPSSRNWVS